MLVFVDLTLLLFGPDRGTQEIQRLVGVWILIDMPILSELPMASKACENFHTNKSVRSFWTNKEPSYL